MSGIDNVRLISASAGSGKTYSLTERVVKAVARDGVAPDRIMAVTFTVRAATELVERIRQRLVNPLPDDLKEASIGRAELRRRAALLSDALIGTVNGICGRLLREFAFEAGLSPALDVLPEEEAERLFRLAISAEIEAFYPVLSEPARRLGRDGGGRGYQKRPDWRDDVRKLVDMARANGIGASALRKMAGTSLEGLAALMGAPQTLVRNEYLVARIDEALAAIAACGDETKTTGKTVNRIEAARRAFERGYWTWRDWGDLAGITAAKKGDACLDDLRACAAMVQRHPQLHADVRAMIEGVFECAARAMESFDAFKRERGLMDFVDQESKMLALLDNERVRERIRERIDIVMVDEFQDTSPIQLALFAKLASLVDRCIWVGDQKQAIYGFRGTDPVLMDAVIGALDASKVDVLQFSWRSRPGLVAFANAVFERAFRGRMPAERVRLEPKRGDAAGQEVPLAVWRVHGNNKADRARALAEGVAGLLENSGQWQVADRDDESVRPARAGDVAILCRTHEACAQLAEALGAFGITASCGNGSLLLQPECAAVLAGIQLLVDERDSLALAELVQYLPGHPASGSWLQALMQEGLEQVAPIWKEDDRIRNLLAMRERLPVASPLEIARDVVDVLQVRDAAYGRARPDQALANLDALENLVRAYEDACASGREAASLPGLIHWLSGQDDPGLPPGRGEDCVQVLTWHAAKGLEWPIVILSDLDAEARHSPFGLHVEPAREFRAGEPLADRGIRYWPEPVKGKNLPLTESVEASPEHARALDEELAERRRLMYVGMTRARDYLVLVQPVAKKPLPLRWLDDLAPDGRPLVELPEKEGEGMAIDVAGETFPCRVAIWTGERNAPLQAKAETAWRAPRRRAQPAFMPYAVSPSAAPLPEGVLARIGERLDLGTRIFPRNKPDMALVGQAVHGFLAVDSPDEDRDARLARAACLLDARAVSDALRPEDVVGMSDRLHAWIGERWPDACLKREWPVRLRMEEQVARGWLDMLIESSGSLAIVDHKTFPGDAGELAARASEYAGQLYLYRQAVAKATGCTDIELWIHFALQGCMVRVEIDG